VGVGVGVWGGSGSVDLCQLVHMPGTSSGYRCVL